MNQIDRAKYMEKSDSLPELLSHACNITIDKAKNLQGRINSIESFFNQHGQTGIKARKMAILYVMMRHGHSARTVELWWGNVDGHKSYSAKTGSKYLVEMKELINNNVSYDEDDNWTPGDEVYEPNKDPLDTYFDIQDQGYDADLDRFF